MCPSGARVNNAYKYEQTNWHFSTSILSFNSNALLVDPVLFSVLVFIALHFLEQLVDVIVPKPVLRVCTRTQLGAGFYPFS
jgi:hypothetical protein